MKIKKYLPAMSALFIYLIIFLIYLVSEEAKPSASINLENFFSADKITFGKKYFSQRVLIGFSALLLKLAVFYFLYKLKIFKNIYVKGFTKIKRSFLRAFSYTSFLLIISSLVLFPLSYISLIHLKSYGIVHTPFLLHLKDFAISNLIFALLASFVISFFIFIYTKYRKYFALSASASTFIFAVLIMVIYPLFITPLFNNFKKLDNPSLQSKISKLLLKEGIIVKNFYVVNASIRTMGANAYVSGLGPTKEIVLYDNLIRDYSTDEILSVVAHEAGHYKMNHIWVGLFVMPVSNPFALFALFSFLGFIIDKKRKTDTDTTFHIPYILFLLIAFSWFINPFINVLSRRMERDADNYSLKLTNNTSAFISAEVKLYSKHAYYNYDPNIFYKFLYYSHPPVKERIEFAKGYEKHIR